MWRLCSTSFVSSESDSARADISGDGIVNIRDLSLVGANFTDRGPRPVYKPTSSADLTYLAWTELVPGAGETVRLNLHAGSLNGIRAFEAAALANSDDWLVEGVDLDPRARMGLSVARRSPWGHRLAVSLIGRESDFGPTETDIPNSEPFVSWRLRRLTAEAAPPHLTEFVLIGRDNMPAESRLIAEDDLVGGGVNMPRQFALGQNFPNPFNPETSIPFAIPAASGSESGAVLQAVRVEVFNTLGQRLRILLADELFPGHHEVAWDGRDGSGNALGSGVYFYRVELSGGSGSGQLVRRMLLVR